jgi:NACalpha-BTF3-like transcription factor
MGWDQEDVTESVSHFLRRLVGIDEDFIAKETAKRMAEMGLTVEKVEDLEGVNVFYGGKMQRVTLSDGRVFVHKMVRSQCSDDWGRDEYELVPEGEEPKVEMISHCDDGYLDF